MLSDLGEAAKVLVPFEDIALGMPGLEWYWKYLEVVFSRISDRILPLYNFIPRNFGDAVIL